MKQHTTPLIITKNKTVILEKIQLNDTTYNEQWIQDICFNNSSILPIDEIEPSFGGCISICKELKTESGPCDFILLNEEGFITIVEFKLNSGGIQRPGEKLLDKF